MTLPRLPWEGSLGKTNPRRNFPAGVMVYRGDFLILAKALGYFGGVGATFLMNTAVESVVDLVTKERQPLAKIAKDTAAGAVLIAAIMAAIAGLIIFVPKLLQIIGY